MDNWFTSIPLIDELLKKSITVIGTVRKNKPEVLPLFVSVKNRPIYGSFFGFQKDKTLVSYKAKKKQNCFVGFVYALY